MVRIKNVDNGDISGDTFDRQIIPKVIHYCWFGNNPKPALFQRCFDSWKKYCPDYEIIEWNEENFDVNSCIYVKEAYEAKKYAFVTDYARLWIVFTYGGVYLDTDVELVKPLDDLLWNHAYFGLEDDEYINTGLGFGAEKGNVVIKRMLDDYSNIRFVQEDGRYNMMTCPIRNTASIASLLPQRIKNGEITNIGCATIYPPEFFCPLEPSGVNFKKTKHTHSIHWFSASWLSEDEIVIHEWRIFGGKCEKYLGKKLGHFCARFIYLFRPQKRKILKKYSQKDDKVQ